MRDRVEIEREMFEARQDLEVNLGRLAHKAREELAIGARARHAVSESVRGHVALIVTTAVLTCMVLAVMVWRSRR